MGSGHPATGPELPAALPALAGCPALGLFVGVFLGLCPTALGAGAGLVPPGCGRRASGCRAFLHPASVVCRRRSPGVLYSAGELGPRPAPSNCNTRHGAGLARARV